MTTNSNKPFPVYNLPYPHKKAREQDGTVHTIVATRDQQYGDSSGDGWNRLICLCGETLLQRPGDPSAYVDEHINCLGCLAH